MSEPKPSTKTSALLEAIKRHPVYALVAVVGVAVTGFATFLSSLSDIKNWFSPPPPPPPRAQIMAVQRVAATKPPRFLVTMRNNTERDAVVWGIRWIFHQRKDFFLMEMVGRTVNGVENPQFLGVRHEIPPVPENMRGVVRHQPPCGSYYEEFRPFPVLAANRIATLEMANRGVALPGLDCIYNVYFQTSLGRIGPILVDVMHDRTPIVRVREGYPDENAPPLFELEANEQGLPDGRIIYERGPDHGPGTALINGVMVPLGD